MSRLSFKFFFKLAARATRRTRPSQCLWSLALVLQAAVAWADSSPSSEYRLGQDLFVGKIAMHGRIRTHLVDLPSEVVRCGNCHAAGEGPDVPRSLAPRLTRDLLREPHARRGGPASIYDEVSFCALLRKGIDPAYVLISIEMPRYTLDDADCEALWRFLVWSPRGPQPN